MVHNGIIENYAILRDQLKAKGFNFNSDTDTDHNTDPDSPEL